MKYSYVRKRARLEQEDILFYYADDAIFVE